MPTFSPPWKWVTDVPPDSDTVYYTRLLAGGPPFRASWTRDPGRWRMIDSLSDFGDLPWYEAPAYRALE
jgi:hypothetical protein